MAEPPLTALTARLVQLAGSAGGGDACRETAEILAQAQAQLSGLWRAPPDTDRLLLQLWLWHQAHGARPLPQILPRRLLSLLAHLAADPASTPYAQCPVALTRRTQALFSRRFLRHLTDLPADLSELQAVRSLNMLGVGRAQFRRHLNGQRWERVHRCVASQCQDARAGHDRLVRLAVFCWENCRAADRLCGFLDAILAAVLPSAAHSPALEELLCRILSERPALLPRLQPAVRDAVLLSFPEIATHFVLRPAAADLIAPSSWRGDWATGCCVSCPASRPPILEAPSRSLPISLRTMPSSPSSPPSRNSSPGRSTTRTVFNWTISCGGCSTRLDFASGQ